MAIDNLGLQIKASEPLIKGGAFLADLTDLLTNYSHSLSAEWLFKSATIDIVSDFDTMMDWLLKGLGRHIEVTNQGGIKRFVGFVNEINATFGSIQYRIGPLNDVANRVLATYTPKIIMGDFVADSGQTETTLVENDASQAIYGIWEKVVQAGSCLVNPATSYNEGERSRDLYLLTFKSPKVVVSTSPGSSNSISLSLTVHGYQDWLGAFLYQNRAFGGVAPSLLTVTAKIQAVFGSDPNAIFSTDYSLMKANSSLQISDDQNYQYGITLVESAMRVGDGTNRWLLWLDEIRRAVFFSVSTAYTYRFRMTDNIQQFFDYTTDALLDPWDILPGKFYLIQDTPAGLGEDTPLDIRRGWIEELNFSAPYQINVSGEPLNAFQTFVNNKAGGAF